MTLKNTTDLRIVKTHKTIRQAMVTLLWEKEFKEITVQDILDHALVNRATFYKYYSGKNDLVAQMITDFKQEYNTALESRFTGDLKTFLAVTAPKFFEQRRLILALWKVRTRQHHLYADMQKIIQTAYVRYASQQLPQRTADEWEFQAALVASLALTSIEFHFLRDKLPTAQIFSELEQMVKLLSAE